MELYRRSTLQLIILASWLDEAACVKDALIFNPRVTPSAVLLAHRPAPSLTPMPYVRTVPLILFCLACPLFVLAVPQTSETTAEIPPNPRELVREVVENGLGARDTDQNHWCYREVGRKDGRRETREVCQTKAGTIDRLIAINDQPVSPEQQRREDVRLRTLLGDPAEIRKERQKQREDSAKQFRMFSTFPEAFRYEYAGGEGNLVKLKFAPNAQFVPSSRQEEVFHHLEGMMWVDPKQKRLARIDGQLTSEVKFAGGLLGHLDKGGVFSVRFKGLDSGQWVLIALHVDMTGRALLFKTVSVQEERDFDDYRRVPDTLTLQQAAELLVKDASAARQSAANTPKSNPK